MLGRLLRLRAPFEAELRFLRRYFGDNLRYEKLRFGATPLNLTRRASAPWGSTAFFPRGAFRRGDPRRPLDLARPAVCRVLAHEAAHIWQRQHGEWVTCRALPLQAAYLCGRDVYRYAAPKEPEALLALFQACNVEQQGQMVGDLVACELSGGAMRRWTGLRVFLRERPGLR